MKINSRNTCRISNNKLEELWDLGNLYISDFLDEKNIEAPKAPLRLGIGHESELIQLMDTADQDSLYRQYWYLSGVNQTMTKQLKDIVDIVPNWVRLKENDIVLDIGCNDGTLLNHYDKNLGLKKYGIDPAKNLSEIAKKNLDFYACDYFNKETFLNLSNEKKAKVITSIAMFYDLEDPNLFAQDIKASLDSNGIWIIQLSYTPLMFFQNAFDNILHEHIEYYTLKTLDYIMKKNGLKILDAELNNTNAGSIRLVITHESNDIKDVALYDKEVGDLRYKSILNFEEKNLSNIRDAFISFSKRINNIKDETLNLLNDIKSKGKKVLGYGASTKGNTLLQYYGITSDLIELIAERQEQKYNKYTAGSWIKIISESEMRKIKPDYLFILPWHFSSEFLHREKTLLDNGTKFIIPLPELKIIS